MSDTFDRPCPCGSSDGYHACCAPLHHGERHADTAEELMRSRYSAYVCGLPDYLFRTWHPRTRPAEVTVDPSIEWTGLRVTATRAGRAGDEEGEVGFTARYSSEGRQWTMHERSRFQRRGGRWCYVDGEVRQQ